MSDTALQDREIHFSNESFVIGMMQALASGSLVSAIAQSKDIKDLAGTHGFLVFITLSAISLIFSVLSAYFKHQYKMWDIKLRASNHAGNKDEIQKRMGLVSKHLKAMRVSIFVSVLSIIAAIVVLITLAWSTTLTTTNHTLYRNSVLDVNMRIHVATFDSKDGNEYNAENCDIAKDLFQNQEGVKVKYWCEPKL